MIPRDADPTRLHGTLGSKKTLQANESKASWVALRKRQESSLRKISWNGVAPCPGVGRRGMTTGVDMLGGGRCRDGRNKTEVNAMSISLSRPCEMQNSRRILNASDESGGATLQRQLFDADEQELEQHRLG